MKDAKTSIEGVGKTLVGGFQVAALFVIGAAIAWSALIECYTMIRTGRAGLENILLLFIYLELATMVGSYFRTDRLPVMFVLFVAITALTRHLAVDTKDLPVMSIFSVTASILVLTLAVLVLQYATSRFGSSPAPKGEKSAVDKIDA